MLKNNGAFVLETERLTIRHVSFNDVDFIIELLNDPAFIEYIGDRGVRTRADARRYIMSGPLDSYARHGFGLYAVELTAQKQPIGLCGLLKRESLPDVDVGFAFLPRFWSKGYAREAAAAVLAYGREQLGFTRILAITSPHNAASINLLAKLGFRYERMVRLPGDAADVKLFRSEP